MANKQLGDVCEFINGGAWKETEYSDSGIHVVKVTNIVAGEIVKRQDDSFLPDSKYDRYQTHELREGDIVVATVGSHPTQPGSVVGRTTRVNRTFAGSFLNQNAVCLRFPEGGEVCSEYFAYLTKTVLFKHHIESRAKGSANQVRMGIGELKKFGHSFPTLSVQRKIAAVLRAYDDLIENNKRRITLLENMAEEIYREWFVRFRFPGWQEAEFEKGLPVNWQAVGLGQIAKFVMGQSPKSEFYNRNGDGLPFHQGVGTFGKRFPTNDIYCSVTGREAKAGDVLFSVRAPVGRLNIALERLVIGRGLAAVRHHRDCQSYLYYLLSTAFSNEDIIGNGAIFNAVGKDELLSFKVLSPSGELVDAFEKLVRPIDDQISGLIRQNEVLEKTKNELLPRLISGKLSVENLDIQFPPSMQTDSSNSADEAAA
jgi:type I restriction enzyme S subunit